MPWKTFLRAHFGVIAATDFFTARVLTLLEIISEVRAAKCRMVALAVAVIGERHAQPLLEAAAPALERWPQGYRACARA
jgi:hypothetical protein